MLLRSLKFSFALFLFSFCVHAAQPLEITRITPKGDDVAPERQIVIQFNQPVVPLGRMERTQKEIPVTIEPKLDCQWRWLNTSALSCNLDEKDALVPATKYTITVDPGIKTESGETTDKPFVHSFITQRPRIQNVEFGTWKSPGTPVLRLVLNQPVTQETLKQHLVLKPFKGEAVSFSLAPDFKAQEFPDMIKLPGEPAFLVFDEAKKRFADDRKIELNGEEARRVWLLTPTKELPKNATAFLSVTPGLVSAYGDQKGIQKNDLLKFDTYPSFKFLGVKCYTNEKDSKEILITPDKNQNTRCNPLGSISLAFTTPVLRSVVKDNAVFSPALNGGLKDYNPWGDENRDWSRLTYAHSKGNEYQVYLPQGLKAHHTYKVTVPSNKAFTDEFGETLEQAVAVTFKTDHRKPNYEMIYRDAVLEKDIDSEAPLYVTNLNTATVRYRGVTVGDHLLEDAAEQAIPAVEDIQFAVPLGIRDMLKGKSGALFGYLTTDPVVDNRSDYDQRLFAQVTPYQLHVKLGHYMSLAWVMDMATGKPVAGAKIRVYPQSFTALDKPTDVKGEAVTDEYGIAVLPGSETLDPDLAYDNAWKDDQPILFVRVDKDDNMALLPLNSSFAINSWRVAPDGVNDWARRKYGHIASWGFTAQGIYRAGDTIQYKIFVRDNDNEKLTQPPHGPYQLEIVDPMGKTVETIDDLTLSSFGAYEGNFKIPEQASVGWYQFRLKAYFDGKKKPASENETDNPDVNLYPLRVLVSDFTPAPFRVNTTLNGDLYRAEQNMDIETTAQLHSGGAYTDASSRVTVTLESTAFTPENPLVKGFRFDSFEDETPSQQLYQTIQNIDAKGERHDRVPLPKAKIVFGHLIVESAVQDDRGKYTASQAKADYIGVDRLVGLKSTQWVYTAGEEAKILYAVVNEKGVPVDDTKVDIAIEQKETVAARVKGAGNAYLTDLTTTWKKKASCEGTSEKEPSTCTFTPKTAGTYRVTAAIKDTKGNIHTTKEEIWVTGKDYVQWDGDSDSYLTIVPEKEEYKIGDTARYLVKNPYPGAQALITIERFGVIDRFVQTLDSSAPVIEFPIKADYVPGFYLSVIVFSPRVDKPIDANQVDLGKPAFRIGYATVPVKDPVKTIDVTVKTDKEVYRPGEQVHADLQAAPHIPFKEKQPIEIAVSVLDESVFDLIAGGRSAFDPYNGFYTLEPLDLRNYSLLTRLVGRQKFEKKGANPGGDGGNDLNMRNVFKYVSYWNATVQTDENGKASIDFKVPDNLTGWRILAVAVTPQDRMGLGEGRFKVNKPTEIRPALPNQVSEGDTFTAGFSVMNRTDQKRTLKISVAAAGDIEEGATSALSYEMTLEPYKRLMVYTPIKAAYLKEIRDNAKGTIVFKATASDALDSDGLEMKIPVLKTRTLETASQFASTTENKVTETVAFPNDIYTDIGGISLTVSPSVIGNVTGAFRYIAAYPYDCWEQKLTKAVMAAHYKELKSYMDKDFSWTDSADLPQKMLDAASSYQAPNGGMGYFIGTNERADPYLSAYTALAFQWLKQRGYRVPSAVEEKLQNYLATVLKKDAVPTFYSSGMTSSVRAVALAALAKAGKITSQDIERYRPAMKEMSLFGKAHFMQAALVTKGGQKAADEAFDALLASSNQSAGKVTFNETYDDGYARILATPMRDQCAILSALTLYREKQKGKDAIGDMPVKMVRGITQTREDRDHWENTQENVFCMNALVDYAHTYEKTEPTLDIEAKVDDNHLGRTSFRLLTDTPVTMSRPIGAKDPGTKSTLSIERSGEGRLYYTASASYAAKNVKNAVNAGMDIKREYSVERNGKWELVTTDSVLKRGELVRVDLYLSLPTARNFVAVYDPLPGGLETVNRDLATASSVDADKASFDAAGGSLWFRFNDWKEYNIGFWNFYHKELRHDSARFYADYLPPGNYHLSYAAQVIADGSFMAAPVKAEEMYDPDVFGRGNQMTLTVKTQ